MLTTTVTNGTVTVTGPATTDGRAYLRAAHRAASANVRQCAATSRTGNILTRKYRITR